ncbi:programmed cell death protein 7 isoform X1 [Patella vulgata]|uniref:programmed cell death protein 7 isoform X1 n=2 Tax=Patella vulgata TaxID=6465 RepID=UPI0024A80F83|nr:programmed cell death protein 7 isoform X1 [Patella vulgata]
MAHNYNHNQIHNSGPSNQTFYCQTFGKQEGNRPELVHQGRQPFTRSPIVPTMPNNNFGFNNVFRHPVPHSQSASSEHQPSVGDKRHQSFNTWSNKQDIQPSTQSQYYHQQHHIPHLPVSECPPASISGNDHFNHSQLTKQQSQTQMTGHHFQNHQLNQIRTPEQYEHSANYSNFRPNFPPPAIPPSFNNQYSNSGISPHANFPPSTQSFHPQPCINASQNSMTFPPPIINRLVHPQSSFNPNHEREVFEVNQSPVNKDGKQQQRITDEAWLVDWLNKIKKPDVKPIAKSNDEEKTCSLKINEAQKQMRCLLVTMATLKNQSAVLEDCALNGNCEDWQTEFVKTETLKKTLIDIQTTFSSPQNLKDLKTSIDKRRKKRDRLKKKKQAKFEEKQAELAQREILDNKIDKWCESVTQKMLDAKQKVEMKKMADKTLSEVRSKISDTTRKLDLLKGLQRLRKIRMEAAVQIGRYTPNESDSVFETKISQLYDILTVQRQVYEGEEKTLKVILEAEQEETQGLQKERKKQIKEHRERKAEKRKNEMLFGKPVEIDETDPLFPFYEFYKKAEVDFNSFLEIRHSWDFWMVPDNVVSGSRIPDEWVLPSIPFNDSWAKYLSV